MPAILSESATEVLSVLQKTIADHWPGDVRDYPLLPPNQAAQRVAFSAHVLLHISKQTGKLAAAFEPMLHGQRPPPVLVVEQQVAYMIINVLRLLDISGGDAAHVLREIEKWKEEQAVRLAARSAQ